MHDSAANAMVGLGFIVVGLVLLFAIGVIVAMVFYLLNLQRCLDATRPEFRPAIPSALVWLTLIPAIGFIVWLAAVVILSSALKREGEARQTEAFGDGGLTVGLISCIFGLLSPIPFLGLLFGLVSLVCWIIHWNKVSTYRRLLAGEASQPGAGRVEPAVPSPVATLPPVAPAPAAPAAVAEAMPGSDATLVSRPEPVACLRCIAGPLQGQEFPVGQGLMLGRSVEASVVIGDPHVSNRHAWVGPIGGKLLLRDNQSTNGTFHNGNMAQRVGEVTLQDGDVVILGDQGKVRFQVFYR